MQSKNPINNLFYQNKNNSQNSQFSIGDFIKVFNKYVSIISIDGNNIFGLDTNDLKVYFTFNDIEKVLLSNNKQLKINFTSNNEKLKSIIKFKKQLLKKINKSKTTLSQTMSLKVLIKSANDEIKSLTETKTYIQPSLF